MNAFYSILNTFFKNFDKKNWSSALLKGKLHFRNLEFNEVVIHQLLELPPHTLVRRMTCDDLRIKATWTKLGSKPIDVQIGTIVLELVEAPSLRKPPRIAQIEPPPPGQYKRSFATNLVENMNIAILCIRISFQPLGDSPATGLPRPMHLALHSLSVQVADAHFHTRINLPDLINANKNQPEVTLYRVVEIETVSLAFGADVILDRSSVNVHVTATLSAADGHLLGGTIAVVIDRLAFAITPLAADALLQTVETMYWLKKKPYDDTTVRCVTLPQHPPPRDVAVVINPADAGVVLADDPEYAKNYGQLIPNRKSRFEPLFEKIWRVDVNIGIVNFEWLDAPPSTAAAVSPRLPVSAGCVVSINHLHVDVYFHDRPLAPDAAEAAARKRVEYLRGKQRVIDERAESRQGDGTESDSSTSSTSATPATLVPVAPSAVSASTRARAESLEQAALARRAAHERRAAAANEAAAEDATGRLQQDVDSLLADVAEIEREREIAAVAGKPVPAVPTPQTPPTKKKNAAKKAVKWTAKITTQATKATARATGRAFRAVNPIGRSASKRAVSTDPQVAAHSALHKTESTPVGLRAASTTATASAVAVPRPPPKVLPPHAIASLPSAQMSQSSPSLLASVAPSPGAPAVSPGRAVAVAKPSATPPPRSKTPVEDDDDDESESLKQLVKARTAPKAKTGAGGGGGGGEDDDWLMVDAAVADTPEPARSVQVASGKEYRDDKNEKWRAELTDATVRVNVSVALLTIRDSTSPADASTYLLQPLMDDRSRRADPAVNVRINVELCHDEHLAVDVGVTLAPMVVRAEADRWSAVSAAVLPRTVRPPPWLPPTDPDEFNWLNVLVQLRALRLTLPPAVRNEATQGLVVCTLRDVALQLIDHDKMQFDPAAFPPASTPALPAPGLGLTRLGVRLGVQSVNVITRQSANDDADDTAGDSPLFDAAPIALAVTLESWRALLRWSGECELIERELARRVAEGDDSDASALLALVPELDEALRDICHARVLLTSQHWHAVVDWAGYDRAATVLASYLKQAAPPAAPVVPVAAAPAVAELSLIRAIPIQIDLNAALDNVSLRLRLRDSEHLPWVLNKPPVAAAAVEPVAAIVATAPAPSRLPAAMPRGASITGAKAATVEETNWDPLSGQPIPAAANEAMVPDDQASVALSLPTAAAAAAPAAAAAATEKRRDVFLLRLQHVGVRVNAEPLPVPERRVQVRVSTLRPQFECGRKVTAAPVGIIVSPTDHVDERALLRKETRPCEVWLSLDAPLAVRDVGSAFDAPAAAVDFQRAGDGTAELGVVGLAFQLHILERDDSDVVGGKPTGPAAPSALVSEHIKPDDFLQLSDVMAINALMRRVMGDGESGGSRGTEASAAAAAAQSAVPNTDLAPLTAELMLSDCDVRVYDRRGRSIVLQQEDERVLGDILSTAVSAVGAQRLMRLRLDGGGEIARRQRAKTSLLLASATPAAAVATPPAAATEVSIERDALRKSLKDASVEIEQLRLERDQLSQQVRVAQAQVGHAPSEADRAIIASLKEMVQELTLECASQRAKLSTTSS